MASSSEQPIICIVGPTASGKSDVAQAVAVALHGEVVSADSMQVYRGMDIGTGKVLPDQRIVPHHCLDLVDPGEPFSASLFQQVARESFESIAKRGARAVLCGGTGFYIRAAIDDYEFPAGEQVGNEVRDMYMGIAREAGPHALWMMLEERDPESAAIIPENDVKRVVRAFELLKEGHSYSVQREKLASIPQKLPAVFIGLAVDPDVLRSRIDARVDKMVESGLVEEVQGLLDKGFREGITAPQAIGYKEIVSFLDGEMSLGQAIELVKVATHRYAKRQRTWFRKDKRISWVDATQFDVDVVSAQALAIINSAR